MNCPGDTFGPAICSGHYRREKMKKLLAVLVASMFFAGSSFGQGAGAGAATGAATGAITGGIVATAVAVVAVAVAVSQNEDSPALPPAATTTK
jgi:hypothetical protein